MTFDARTSPVLSRSRASSDFMWRDGRIEVRKTGVRLSPDLKLAAEVVSWIVYLSLLGLVSAISFMRRRTPLSVWFAPDRPRPWYLIRGAALWGGIGVADSVRTADAAIYFDDVTCGAARPVVGLRSLNFGCDDVSKSHVARVFEAVFGYPLSVDPRTATGQIVEKSETNGVHDGRIVQAPLIPRPGYAYQRLIDTADSAGYSRDLRTPCAGGEPVLVWIKVKPAGARFAIHNRKATLHDPREIYSPRELEQIRAFNARMGADWGGLDILRDRNDGRIYIVDVNKTDVGPVIALSWVDKIISMNRLSKALERLVRGG